MKGTIEINVEKKTISIRLENGSFCLDHYPNGIKHFLEEEIECLETYGTKAHTPNGWTVAND